MSASGASGSQDAVNFSAVNSSIEKLLECPVCLKFLDGNIFICESGHPSCGDCKTKLKNVCPSCKKPFLNTRNLALEHVAEQIYRLCVSERCEHLLTISQQKEHLLECKHRVVECPSCEWKGSIRKLADHVAKANHQGYGDNFALDRDLQFTDVLSARNQWKWWFRIDDDRNVLQFRIFISDTGCSTFCGRLFGTKSEASKYRYKLELKSLESGDRKGTAAATAKNVVQQSTLFDDVHCDLELEDGKCIPLVNYDGLLRLGLINNENTLRFSCTVFKK